MSQRGQSALDHLHVERRLLRPRRVRRRVRRAAVLVDLSEAAVRRRCTRAGRNACGTPRGRRRRSARRTRRPRPPSARRRSSPTARCTPTAGTRGRTRPGCRARRGSRARPRHWAPSATVARRRRTRRCGCAPRTGRSRARSPRSRRSRRLHRGCRDACSGHGRRARPRAGARPAAGVAKAGSRETADHDGRQASRSRSGPLPEVMNCSRVLDFGDRLALCVDLTRRRLERTAGGRMSARTYLGFLPWLVFAFVAAGSLEGVAWGAVAAVFTAGLIAAGSARTRSVKELEIFSLVLFTALAVAGALEPARPAGLPAALPQRSRGRRARLLRGRLARLPALHRAVRPRARAAEVLEHPPLQPRQRRAHAHVGRGVHRRSPAPRPPPARSRPGSAPRSSTGSCRSGSSCSASARRRCGGATSSTRSRWASTPSSTRASSGTRACSDARPGRAEHNSSTL